MMPIQKDWQEWLPSEKGSENVALINEQSKLIQSEDGLCSLSHILSLYFMVKPLHPTNVIACFSDGEGIQIERGVMR